MEDRRWFPDFAGNGDWLKTLKFAAYNFKDESFILQYLSPKVIRDFGLFYVLDDDEKPSFVVEAIQNDEGYRLVREKLAEQQNFNNISPNVQVTKVNVWTDRSIHLEHQTMKRHKLHRADTLKVMEHVGYLWGYDVHLTTVDEKGNIKDTYVHKHEKGDVNKK